MKTNTTEATPFPFMRQYLALKREIPAGAVLCVRMGEYWETLGEDAQRAAPILDAPLVRRGGVPMCGFRHDSLNAKLAQLVRVGVSVALAEAVECKTGRLPRREITRIITPGI